MRSVLLRLAPAGVLLGLSLTVTWGQERIPRPIDVARRVPLDSRLNPNARPEDDQGVVDSSMEISYATLYLKPTAAQQAALEKLLVDQQDPASPDYRRWLTPDEFGDRFGLSRGDASRIVSWLESQGVRVNEVARGRRWITFTGTAAAVGRAFHTEFHRYGSHGEMHFANATVPSAPEALSDVVAGVEGLDDYYPVPAGGNRPPIPLPQYTSGSSGSHYLSPDDFATIYDLKPIYAAGIDGTGQTVAVVGNTDIDLTDLRNFRSRFNLAPNDPKLVLVGPDPGFVSEDEAYLDLEWVGAVARNANVLFVYAKSTTTAVQYVVDQRLAPVVTESFGTCEPAATRLTRMIAQQANAEGITWMASSGDGGAAGCDHQGKMPMASKGMAVQSPASIPEVTAVGGTEFDDANGTYWNQANSNGASAISYIPEKAWNDSLTDYELVASTGGPSISYAKPWWQAGTTPDDGARDVPDVALNASCSHDGYIIYANGSDYAQGGTSASAPAFAGFVVLLNQYLIAKGALAQPGLGNINPTLYRLAQSVPSAFHDIVKGDNIVPCMQGTPDCLNGSFGYSTGRGYDLVTGLGSIDAYKLAAGWSSGTATRLTVAASPATIAFAGGNVKLTATVTVSGATPTGEVAFVANDVSLGTATLSGAGGSATATLTVSALALPVGASVVTAVYGGAAGLNCSAGITTVTVTAPATASAVVASISPDPVYQHAPDASGHRWSCTMRLTNESAVATTLTKLTINGTDYSSNIKSWFGTAAIPANGAISASVDWKSVNAPMDMPFAFAGADAGGATWSQQISVPFVATTIVEPSLLVITPATVSPDPAAPASCRWAQPLVVEEQGGYESRLTTLTAGGVDISDRLAQIFGTSALAPFGRLQGTLCWSSGAAAGAKSVSVTAGLVESSSATVSATASTSLATSAPATIVTAAVSPASIQLSPDSSGTATATAGLSFSSGSPAWTAQISPANTTTGWLTVSPLSGTGAAQIKLSASSAGLSKGVYNTNLLVQAAGAKPQFLTVPVVLVVGGSSHISIGGVASAASYKTIFAPGMLISVFGTNLAPQSQHAAAVPLPLSMQGVTATVNGFPAPLLDVTPSQLNLQVPYEAGAGTAILGVDNNGQVAYFPFPVQAAAPGIFMTLDGANNLTPYASGRRGQVLPAFITGEGIVSPSLITGRTPTTSDISQLPAPCQAAAVTVGGAAATIDFIGIPNGLVGVTQINFTVPTNAPLGKQDVVVTIGGVASAPVSLTITP